eukprot:421079-Pleurochrysis_carterae.AAC.1
MRRWSASRVDGDLACTSDEVSATAAAISAASSSPPPADASITGVGGSSAAGPWRRNSSASLPYASREICECMEHSAWRGRRQKTLLSHQGEIIASRARARRAVVGVGRTAQNE